MSLIVLACARTAPVPSTRRPTALAVTPAPLARTLDEARILRAAGKLVLYEQSLQALVDSPDRLVSHRALALLAFFYIDQKRTDEAIAALERAADAYPEAAPWLRLRLAALQRDAGRYHEAIAATARVALDMPASSAATIARMRLPALDALAGDLAGVESSLKDAMSVPIDELSEQEFVNLAADLEKAGRQDSANSVRMRLVTQHPEGRFTERMYALLKNAPQAPLDALSTDDALSLARKLGGEDHYDEALDLLERIAKRAPQAAISADYRNFRLHALFNSRRYEELLSESDNRKLKDPELLLLRARAAWRADRPRDFLAGLKRVERLYPKSGQAAEAKLLRAKYYTVDEPKLDAAIENLEKGIKASGPGSEGENLWTLGWTYLLAKQYDDALKTFGQYARQFPDGDYLTNAFFWSAKIYERLGQIEKRNAAFDALLSNYPYSYYSYRAREILQRPPIAPKEASSGNVFPDIESEIAALNEPRLDSIRELAWLELYREATAEMKAIAAAHPDNVSIAFKLADLYSAGGEPLKAINVLQRRFRPFVRHGGTGVPRRFWEILFPLKYWEAIRAEAERRQIDPYLIASIIRQESGFEPTVVSNAGAVGIMQIMPQDAERISAAAGLPLPSRQQLFDPPTNIAIGVAEYAQKLAVMHGTHVLAIAAYNAGEEAVGKWIAQTPVDDMDLFVDSIPYSETRLYVKSVTRNRFEYRRIYEGVSSS